MINFDTSTTEGLKNTLYKRIAEYEKAGNKVALVRMIGGSVDDFGDYQPSDAGESPKQLND